MSSLMLTLKRFNNTTTFVPPQIEQAAGKKRMKQVGQVEIPQEAFLAVLESDT